MPCRRHGKDGNLTLQDYRCALGTSIVRVFGRAFGMTGSSEKALAVSKTVPYSRVRVTSVFLTTVLSY